MKPGVEKTPIVVGNTLEPNGCTSGSYGSGEATPSSMLPR
jgi:hypothetical protein